MNTVLWTFLLSMTPIGELRAGIPFGLSAGLPIWLVFLISLIGNFLVVPCGWVFLEFIHYRFLHVKHYQSLFEWLMERTRKRAHAKIDRYGYIGLFLLVAIPLPFTGAYTATLAAWFFGMRPVKAALAILLGLVCASIIVFLLSTSVLSFF